MQEKTLLNRNSDQNNLLYEELKRKLNDEVETDMKFLFFKNHSPTNMTLIFR